MMDCFQQCSLLGCAMFEQHAAVCVCGLIFDIACPAQGGL